jgi:hypothetical protein
LVAIYEKDRLFFRSFALVSRFIDLADYESEASEEEIDQFVSQRIFDLEDGTAITTTIQEDGWLRRRVASIHQRPSLHAAGPWALPSRQTARTLSCLTASASTGPIAAILCWRR